MDDTRPATIRTLKRLANDLIEKHDGDIRDICDRLAPKPRRKAAATKRRAAAGKGRTAPAKVYAVPSKARAAARKRTSAKKSAR
jgi:hypothetical protein